MNKTSAAIVRTLLLGTSCLSLLNVGLDAARAQPTGGTVVLGTATIADHGNTTTITQRSDKTLINWNSFSIAAGGTVRFNQPGTGSIALNRVTGSESSAIYGSLLANGQVWLINGNGILFGGGSRINVGGLIATTSDIADADFASGNYSFNGATGGTIVNQGTIRTQKGGSVVLSGAGVANQGLISADTGTVVLGGASAFTVDFYGDNLLRYAITAPAGKADGGAASGVSNSGTISAAGGRVLMTARAAASVTDAVVNNTGMISATSAKLQNGEVVLDAGDGDANVGGTINASGTGNGQTGGSVTVTGRNITVADNTQIDVSGDAGGGTVRIGGDLHGAGPLQNADSTHVGNATIKADAIRKGNGGTLVVWSNGLTDFSGVFSAKGGALGGDGGFIETSGHTLHVSPDAKIDTSAAHGRTGNWLLDPDYIYIENDGTTPLPHGSLTVDEDAFLTDTIAPATIVAALATTNVTLEAQVEIDVFDDINYNSVHDLRLLSGGDIYIAANVQNAGTGAVTAIAGWDGTSAQDFELIGQGRYGAGGGSVYVTSDYDRDAGDETEGEGEPDEVRPVSFGSAGGLTTVAGAGVAVLAYYDLAQIGYHGAGGGDIVVRAKDGIEIDGSWGYDAQIGNGAFAGDLGGAVTGNIDIRTPGTLLMTTGDADSHAWIGNVAGNANTETGNVVLVTGTSEIDFDFSQTIIADLAGGDVTLGTTDQEETEIGGLAYNSSHALTLLTTGDFTVSDILANAGSGAITLVAGWDGTSITADELSESNAFGQNDGRITIGGEGADGDVFVGSHGGAVTVEAAYLDIDAEFGNAQLGFKGNGTGDISVFTTHDVSLTGQAPGGAYAMIGNGALDGLVSGPVSGSIFMSVGGSLNLATTAGCEEECPGSPGITIGIGNVTALPDAPSGNVVILTGGVNDKDDGNGGFGLILTRDLDYGNVTVSGGGLSGADMIYNSDHDFTYLSTGDIDVTSTLRNDGAGAITLVAGWNGVYDPSHLGAFGTYGRGGSITVGGEGASGNVSIGAASGALNIFTTSLTLSAINGYAQVGYHGAGGGNISVHATQDIIGVGNSENPFNLQLGNGTLGNDVSGNITGNINLDAGGQIVFFSQVGRGWLGNSASAGFSESGNVTAVSVTGSYSADYMEADMGTSAGTGGNLFIGFRDNLDIQGFRLGGLDYSSPHSLVFANAGSLDVLGNVINHGTGDVTLVAGWDGSTIGSAADLEAANAYGQNGAVMNVGGNHHYTDGDFSFNNNQFQNISVGSAGGLTSILTGGLVVAPAAGYYAQIGYHGSGGGAIDIFASGNLTLTAGAVAHDYAMIGNGSLNNDVSGAITGDIAVDVGGHTALVSAPGTKAWIGNVAGSGFGETGNVLLETFDLDAADSVEAMLGADLSGGDVTVAITDSTSTNAIDKPFSYNSAHTLNLLTAGSFEFDSSLQNTGSGAINIVAGWDGATLDAAHFGDAHVYGNHNGNLLFGGANAVGNVAVGSAGGATSLYANAITLNAVHGYAQVGYHGASAGALNVFALNNVSVLGSGANFAAQIGNGGYDVGGIVGGAVSVNSGSLTLTASASTSSALVGDVGGSNASESGNVTINTHGGALAMSASAQQAVTHVGNWAKGSNTGSSSGNITIDAGAVSLIATGLSSYNQIGNGSFRFSSDAGTLSGDILIHATTFLASATANSQSRVGNLGFGASSGNLSLFTTGNVTLTGDNGLVNIGNVSGPTDINGNNAQGQETGNLLVQSGGAIALSAVNGGNARIENGGALSGALTVTAAGDITLTAGAPADNGQNSLAFIGALVAGNGGVNIAVTSTGGKVQLDANGAGSIVQIGNYQNAEIGGTMSGTVSVTAANLANGNIGLTAGGVNATAQIGNSGFGGEIVNGDVSLIAGNAVTVGNGNTIFGDTNQNPSGDSVVPAPFSGNLFVSAKSLSGNIAPSLANDLSGGDVLLEIFGPSFALNKAVGYNSSHSFTVLAAGDIAVTDSIQNACSGAINLIAGWNGTTTNAAHLADAGVFGNNNGSITIGGAGADGNASVGSAGGTTNVAAKNLTLSGLNGYAQLGFHGSASGAIFVNALGAVSLIGGAGVADYGQIGHGVSFGSNANAGDVSVASGTITQQGNGAVTAVNLKLAAASGGIGASNAALRVAAGTLSLQTAGASVFLSSPGNGVSFAGSGVNLGGANLTLTAGGTIGQTAAIHVGALNVSTSTGSIVLNNTGNSFGSLFVTTLGGDNASITDSGALSVASATVGGNLTLATGGALTQTGVIHAAGLTVLTSSGAITLTNAGNAFGTLTVSTQGSAGAAFADSSAVTIASANVAGFLTLAAGGAIGQTGAIHTSALNVSTTSGAILLTNAANTFGALTVATPGNASFAHASLISVASANVGGTLTLAAGTGVNQTGAIVAGTLNVSAANGTIVLTNAGNSFGTLTVSTAGTNDASLTDSSALVLAGATVGGKLTLVAGGAVSQTGAIAARGLAVSTTAGAIILANAANSVTAGVQFNTPGAVTFANALTTNVAGMIVGGDLTLLSKGNINFVSSVQSTTGNITAVAGWDGTTTAPAAFGNAGVYGNGTGNIFIGGTGATGPVAVGSKSGTTSLYASNLTIAGINGLAQLGYHGTGGGAILVRALHDMTLTGAGFTAMLGNGSLTGDVTGNETGDIDVRLGGNANFNGGGANAQTWFGNVAHSGSETGNVIFVMSDENGTQDGALASFVTADIVGGDFTIGFTGSGDQGPNSGISYNSSHTLTALTAGNFIVAGSVQNAGTGAINIVGGWDGHTLSGFGAAGVAGNNGKGVVIGGSHASGNVAVGSAGGLTSVFGASLAVTATNGYAQLGYNGHGSGGILVNVSGGVSVTGGSGAGQFGMIGNGGLKTSGNNSGDIVITAGGDVVLTGGSGTESFVQVGHGGAESNTGANGYSNVAAITVTAANLLLNAGTGNAAYVQLGSGGYKSGLNLAGGTANNGGNITVTVSHSVTMTGNGDDAYVQIGNGGSQSNLNAAASAGGSDFGDIIVHAPNGGAGSITLAAGLGANAYAQIGEGGYAVNSGATSTAANWTITGNVTVTDLSLAAGNGGPNAYSQIGNGDASHNATGNISGTIVIDANGQITYIAGSSAHSQATIGNFTGQGTVTVSLSGATPPPEVTGNATVIGNIASNTANNGSNVNHVETIATVVIINTEQNSGGPSVVVASLDTSKPGPLASLDDTGGDSSAPNSSDSATVVIADSLDGAKKAVGSQTILAGMLKQTMPSSGIATHGVPPADQDFSSWGNEALWQ